MPSKYVIIMNGLQLVESCWPVTQTHETSIKLKYLLEIYSCLMTNPNQLTRTSNEH